MHTREVAVVGSGSWATAIVKILLNNVEKVHWWVKEKEIADHLLRYNHNPHYLSSVEFDPERLHISTKLDEVLSRAEIIIFCIPAVFLHQTVKEANGSRLKGKLVVSAIKGIVPEYNAIIADYFNEHFRVDYNRFVVVSGPSHAEEVAQEKLTYLTVASENSEYAREVSGLFDCRYIFTSLSDDIFGTEYAPVLKNIIAIASGICSGLGYGDNFQAVLISNAIQEIENFVAKVHPIQRDIKSSVYLGDLLVTCYSQFSRNRTFGTMIGKGYSVKFAQLEMKMIAEGYFATKCIRQLNLEYGVEMPIVEAVFNILYNNQPPSKEIKDLAEKLS